MPFSVVKVDVFGSYQVMVVGDAIRPKGMGGRGQTPNPNFCGLYFGNIENKSGDGRFIPLFGSKL